MLDAPTSRLDVGAHCLDDVLGGITVVLSVASQQCLDVECSFICWNVVTGIDSPYSFNHGVSFILIHDAIHQEMFRVLYVLFTLT